MKWGLPMAALAIGCGLTCFGWVVWSHRLAAERQSRESHFIAIHFRATELAREDDKRVPKSFDQLVGRLVGGADSGLLKPFPEGLIFRSEGSHFTLEEPRASRISFRRADRLVATDSIWPHWERSGDVARKFQGQEVPAPGHD